MSSLRYFLAQNAEANTETAFVVSTRFKDEQGEPVPWQLRSISEVENEQCRKAATKQKKGKGGAVTPEIDFNEYTAKLIVASVAFPDLKNSELQQSYGVMGSEALLRKMLLPGEYAALLQEVQALNGFNQDMNELIDEVKN